MAVCYRVSFGVAECSPSDALDETTRNHAAGAVSPVLFSWLRSQTFKRLPSPGVALISGVP